ncbi:hypothetical protein QFC24_006358 [Naganishia onofrii]|uniref:Uncharacterized protein n=1 Tax=Naganishia onofrii TaxID=1851511 RepID=A0ACC2X357_9TREE|nr:hypothetical protein QFC24_006358 [Naganishia onofrii]
MLTENGEEPEERTLVQTALLFYSKWFKRQAELLNAANQESRGFISDTNILNATSECDGSETEAHMERSLRLCTKAVRELSDVFQIRESTEGDERMATGFIPEEFYEIIRSHADISDLVARDLELTPEPSSHRTLVESLYSLVVSHESAMGNSSRKA